MYDSQNIFNNFVKVNLDMTLIPNVLEKYVSYSIGKQLKFINSFQFAK